MTNEKENGINQKELLQKKIADLKTNLSSKDQNEIIEDLNKIESDLEELKIEAHDQFTQIHTKIDSVLTQLPSNWLVIITPCLLMVKTAWEQWQKFTTKENLSSLLDTVKENLKNDPNTIKTTEKRVETKE